MASSLSSPPRYVLDSSVFFTEWRMEGECSTVPGVVEELIDRRSKWRLELFLEQGLRVREPSGESLAMVMEAERSTGEEGVLSGTDRDLVALALDLGASLVTDDFAVQNVAHELGIPTVPLQQRRALHRHYRYRCTGCGMFSEDSKECPVCGAPMRRTIR